MYLDSGDPNNVGYVDQSLSGSRGNKGVHFPPSVKIKVNVRFMNVGLETVGFPYILRNGYDPVSKLLYRM